MDQYERCDLHIVREAVLVALLVSLCGGCLGTDQQRPQEGDDLAGQAEAEGSIGCRGDPDSTPTTETDRLEPEDSWSGPRDWPDPPEKLTAESLPAVGVWHIGSLAPGTLGSVYVFGESGRYVHIYVEGNPEDEYDVGWMLFQEGRWGIAEGVLIMAHAPEGGKMTTYQGNARTIDLLPVSQTVMHLLSIGADEIVIGEALNPDTKGVLRRLRKADLIMLRLTCEQSKLNEDVSDLLAK